MKTLKALTLLLAAMILTTGLSAQTSPKTGQPSTKTETFKAYGNCDMCKSRIESALKTEGVKKAEWDQKTKIVKVTYDPSVISMDAMQKKVASAGHDTEKYRAPDDVYNKLPGCCHYTRAK